MKLIVYSPDITPRLRYILKVLFGQFYAIDFLLTSDRSQYLQSGLPKINYSVERLAEREIFLPASGFLKEKGIRPVNPEVKKVQNYPAFFHSPSLQADLPFDPFALCFYLLSRYEEYLPFSSDPHGRFPAGESLAFQNNFLKTPLVDVWAQKISWLLKQKFNGFIVNTPPFRYQPTFDVDLAWAYLHRPWGVSLGAFLKDILAFRTTKIKERLATFTRKTSDPFFTFPYIRKVHSKSDHPPIFFFLLADKNTYDRNSPPEGKALQDLIKSIAREYPVGIHPSYASNENPGLLTKEIDRLRHLTSSPVTKSRQHFLKLSFPQTYQHLIKAGIKEDYSMGYAAQTGYRAGTAHAFPWYDLAREEETSLLIHPFQVMDVTLKNYLGLNPMEATQELTYYYRQIQENGGTFCTLWHNSSFASTFGWEGWKEVYENIIL